MMFQRKCDKVLLGVTLVLLGIGALLVYSSTSVVTPTLAK